MSMTVFPRRIVRKTRLNKLPAGKDGDYMGKSNKVCPNCGRKMKQQFIGLQHCKCGMSWKKDIGYFERTNDMVFALQRQVTKKGKNSVRTKQVPIIRYKNEAQPQREVDTNMGTICNVCKGDMLKVDGCKPSVFIYGGKEYARVKVGDAGDFYEDGDADTRCTDCGAKYGHFHHDGCDCELCPVCGGQLLTCGCDLHVANKKV